MEKAARSKMGSAPSSDWKKRPAVKAEREAVLLPSALESDPSELPSGGDLTMRENRDEDKTKSK